jgi:hypothetical protein
MKIKQILVIALLVATGSANALTLEQSRGMMYARCAGVYMTEASIAFGQNRMEDYEAAERLLSVASTEASERIGDGRTTDIGEATVSRLLNLHRKNPTLAKTQISKERLTCQDLFDKTKQE